MFANLTRRELPEGDQAICLVRRIRDYLRDECRALMHLDAPAGRLIVVGDLHGHFNDLMHVRHQFGVPSSHNMFLFNGDFVDRGVWGPEVLFMLFCYKLMYKKYVHLNRGNHESFLCTNVYGFKTHLACAYPFHHHLLEPLIQEAFDQLPLCYVIGKQVCVVHGGLPKFDVTLADIAKLQRGPVPFPGRSKPELLFQALLWSDPKPSSGPSDRGLGWHFSPSSTRHFLRANGLKHLIRSHECIESGCSHTHGGLVTTVFSASNYILSNNACVAIVDSKLNVHVGDAWNEAYVKVEWMNEQELQQLSRVDLGDTDGFTDFEVSITVPPGQDLGVEFSLESPHLEIPVVLDIFEKGCFAEYNAAHPEHRIEIGDAIIEVNGDSGYAPIVASLLRQNELHFKMRRPQRLDFHVARADCPASMEPLKFPAGGYGYCMEAWGRIISRFDRIVSVNGHTLGADMQEAMTNDEDLHLKVLRYAPPELYAATPDERRESFIRRSSSACWEDRESARRAVEALQERIGDSFPMQSSSKDVLRECRALVWTNRPRLLEAFQVFDRISLRPEEEQDAAGPDYDPNIKGLVDMSVWARVMRSVMHTPADFPWEELRPYLAEVSDDGKLSYMGFLDRFGNPLATWLMSRWVETALDRLVHIIDRPPSVVFDSIDADGDGKVSYASLRPFFRKHLYSAEPRSKRERRGRDVQCFALYRHFVSKAATISRRKFVKILSARSPASAKHCPAGHRLTSARLGMVRFLAAPQVCDDCGKAIGAYSESSFCRRCDFDICKSCCLERSARDRAHVLARKETGQKIIRLWYHLDSVLMALVAAECEVSRIFGPEDSQAPAPPDATVTRDRFVCIVSDLVSGDRDAAAELFDCILQYLEEEGLSSIPREKDEIKVSDLGECLRIVDSRDPYS